MVLQQTSGVSCTTGGSLQKRPQNLDPDRRSPAALPSGPHRPYEGSQLISLNLHTDPFLLGSSSPLRGVATFNVISTVLDDFRPVLIAPTRGRNFAGRACARTALPGPHRPYEGSQLVTAPDERGYFDVLIAPTRGRNLPTPEERLRGLHVLIAPTRGRNSHVHTDEDESQRPHRPYEGSQPRMYRPWYRSDGVRSSSPLRGVATHLWRVVRIRLRRVLIAPTRGRNTSAPKVWACPRASSSPLRGVATRPGG